MSKKKTTEEFIKEAKILYGDKYDYSKVEYFGNKQKVCIICPKHGEFWQTPNSHLRGRGCPKCGGTAKSNTREFIKRAESVHGNKYNYSLVDYKTSKRKVKIICPEHGVFEQTPDMHLKGRGCPKCNAYNSRKAICGVGIYDMPYEESDWADMNIYSIWRSMIRRCYSKKVQLRQPTYADCSVCKEWHYYSNYKKWYEEHYVEGWCVDKDILFKGNREYAPDKCCFVPNEINVLFSHKKRKSGLPVGVVFNIHNKYVAKINMRGENYHLGCFDTPEEAFQAYKVAKEAWIKEVANKWKGKIADNVYEAMMNYEVEITD